MATHHVIIGAGPAATSALETLRTNDPDARITVVCDEPAHSRMALPYWLADRIPREHTLTGGDGYFDKLGADTRIGIRVDGIDTGAKQIAVGGDTVGYDKLLIATGSSPLGLPIEGADLDGVQPLWSLAHTESALASVAGQERPRVVLVGAGFIGLIVLNAMFKRGWDLTVVERESQVLPRMLNAEAAAIAGSWLAKQGVAVHTGTSVKAIRGANGQGKTVELDNGTTLQANLVIIATGVQPNVDIAKGAGLDTDHGVLVDDHLRTSAPDVYAAGDVAQGPVLGSDAREVHAIQPTAIDHGRVAAANMAGGDVAYPGSLSMNVLDVCGLQCASYGAWNDPGAETTTIANGTEHIYRQFLWTGDRITGAAFAGRASDMGMLTDVGMTKGLIQSATELGPWKGYLQENPFDVRRPYVGTRAAEKLAATTLLGKPARARGFHYRDTPQDAAVGEHHAAFVGTRDG